MIYFIRSEATGTNVKVGYSEDPRRRARSLALPGCEILAELPGGREVERAIHARWKHLRLGDSEWFAASPRLEAYIDGLQHPGGAKNLWEEAAKLFSEVVG